MRIVFLYQLPRHVDLAKNDGLAAALQIIDKGDDEVLFWNLNILNEVLLPLDADFYLAWGGALSQATKVLLNLPIAKNKKGLCFGGCSPDQYKEADLSDLGVVFVESENDVALGDNFRFAFGVNTEVYKPLLQKKTLDVIYAGAVVGYKRQDLFVNATRGFKSMVVGELGQGPDDIPMINDCITSGWAWVPYIPPEGVNSLVNTSYVSLITANAVGGSQRFMLESLAANVPVIVMNDAPYLNEIASYFEYEKTGLYQGIKVVPPEVEPIREAIRNIKISALKPDTRKIVLEKFSETNYAEALRNGIYETREKAV